MLLHIVSRNPPNTINAVFAAAPDTHAERGNPSAEPDNQRFPLAASISGIDSAEPIG